MNTRSLDGEEEGAISNVRERKRGEASGFENVKQNPTETETGGLYPDQNNTNKLRSITSNYLDGAEAFLRKLWSLSWSRNSSPFMESKGYLCVHKSPLISVLSQ